MLTIFSGKGSRDCDGLSRRDFIRVGSLALGGLSLADLLSAKAHSAPGERSFIRDKAVVLLYLSGGASHIETFDPKMTAPSGTRSVTGEHKTNLPGVTFGGTFPLLAKNADKMAVVRSFQHSVGSHVQAHVHVLSGGTDPTGKGEQGFSMGSLFARLRGTNHPESGMPTYALLTENEVDGQYRSESGRIAKGSHPGTLGPSYAPFDHKTNEDASGKKKKKSRSGQGSLFANMQLNLPPQRFDNRMALLGQLDRINRQIDGSGLMDGMDHFTQQAVNVMLGGAAKAFDFKKESARTIERYDTSSTLIGHKVFRPSTLGRQMLVARRLCEAGCGFVTVHSAGWDMHADGNNPGIVTGMEMLGRALDRAVSAFLEDVQQRGLSDKILLVITGDFGRTPRLNKKGGRDHWTKLSTLALAGGGLRMGQVVGQSARGADSPSSEPITPGHLMGTLMHTLLDVGQLRIAPSVPRDLVQLIDNSQTIRELF